MTPSRLFQRAVMIYLTGANLFVGVWATFGPRTFYDSFPGLGRIWVAVDGPFNEHLVRDVGQLSLGLAVATLAAAATMRPSLVRTAAAASLVSGLPHLLYHLRHLSGYETLDQIGNVVSLGTLAALPAVVLAVARDRPSDRSSGGATGCVPDRS